MAHDRARRDFAARPITAQFVKPQGWPEPKPVPEAAPSSAAAPQPERAAALPLPLMLMIGVSFGAVIGLTAWPVLQALGVVGEPVIATVQRNQAGLLARLDSTVHGLSAAVAQLGARVDSAGEQQEAARRETEASFVALRSSLRALREDAARDSWQQPVAELTAAATKARGDIVRLRASLDALSRQRQSEAAATGAIRGSIPVRAEPPPAPPEISTADGHLFDLKPAR